MVDGDDPVQCKEVDPCVNSRAVHILPHNSGTVIDSEKSSTKANRKSTMGTTFWSYFDILQSTKSIPVYTKFSFYQYF